MSPIPKFIDPVARANITDRQPVIFIHGLWLKPSFWDRWAGVFEASGYAAIAPGWPAEAGGAMAPETIGEVAAHFAGIANALDRRPAIIGHSVGGLIAQILAGQGLSAASVAIDPAPFRGVPPLPAPGMPIFQAADANLNPWTEARVDTEAARRGPLLVISGERDHTVPSTLVHAACTRQSGDAEAITEFKELAGRGHSLPLDAGWREVAEVALAFIERFV